MRFGYLTPIAIFEQPRHRGRIRKRLLCVCECGNLKSYLVSDLRSGEIRSCGCWKSRPDRPPPHLTHGEARTNKRSSEYRTWDGIKRRCSDPKRNSWKYYGARGITVCERWMNSYENFLADMGRRPSPQHSIDRYPNNDGNYESGNCRWATAKEQSANKRIQPRSIKSG